MDSTTSIARTRLDPTARLAFGALVFGAIVIGFSGILVKLSEVGPVATGFYRLGFAVPAFLLWVMVVDRGIQRRSETTGGVRANLGVLVLSGAMFAADVATFHWSLEYTTVANAALLSNLAPIWVTIGAWFLFRQRVSRGFVVGLVAALAGCVVLMSRSLELGADNLKGDALAISTSIFYAGYLLTIAHLRARLSTATVMLVSSAACAAFLAPLALAVGDTMVAHSLAGWLVLIALGVLIHGGGQGMIAFAFAHLPAGFSSLSLLIQPVAAAILAWIILGEAVGPVQAAGGAVVLFGILIARRATLPAQPSKDARRR